MEPTCDKCSGDLHLGTYHVVVTKNEEEEIANYNWCKKCAQSLITKKGGK